MNDDSQLHRRLVFSLCIIAALIRFIGVWEKQLWADEIIQVIHSTPDSFREILKGVVQDKGGAPLDYIVQHYTMRQLAQYPAIAPRIHAVVFGSISVVLLYVLSLRLLGNRRIALLSTALFAFYPFHHHYSQEGRPYALFVMLALLVILLYLAARNSGNPLTVIALVIVSTLAMYTTPFAAILLGMLCVISILRRYGCRTGETGLAFYAPLISCLIAAGLYLPWLAYSFSNTHGDSPDPLSWRILPEALKGIGDGSYPVSIILLFLSGCGLVSLWQKNREKFIDLLCWLAVPIPMVLAVLHLRSYFFSPRQILFITPAIMILAACGARHLWTLYGRKASLIPAAYFLICIIVLVLHYPDRRADLRGTAQYLIQTVQKDDSIYAPGSLGLLSYYYPGVYRHELAAQEQLSPGQRVFVVETPFDGPPGSLCLSRIKRNRILVNQQVYNQIKLSIFEPARTAVH